MQLLIDIGNSRLKWAFYTKGELGAIQAIYHRGANLDRLLHSVWRNLPCPRGIWVANVAGLDLAEALTSWADSMWGVAPHFVKASLYGLGMKNGYDLPEELGADRWIAMLASWQLSSQKRPICVIDCGTCITMDTLDQFGKHLGGLIIPGIESMRSAILTFTQGCSLQRKPSQVNQSLLAKNSYDGVMGGTVYATVACIERLLKELKDELGEAPEVFLTGGEASCIEPLLSRPVVSHPNLVIEGLSLLAKQQLKTQLEQRLRHVQEPAN